MTIVDPFRMKVGLFRDPERTRPVRRLNKLDDFESTDPVSGFHY